MSELLTTQEAARLARRHPDVVRQWASRGHLHPAGRTRGGRPLYEAAAVLRAEHDARTRSRNGYAERALDAS